MAGVGVRVGGHVSDLAMCLSACSTIPLMIESSSLGKVNVDGSGALVGFRVVGKGVSGGGVGSGVFAGFRVVGKGKGEVRSGALVGFRVVGKGVGGSEV